MIAARSALVLLIEDNPDHAHLISEALVELRPPPRLTVISDGQQALDYVRAAGAGAGRRPDLVLLDLKLPKVDGRQILRAIRAAPAWIDVPVVILTTSNRQVDVEDCLTHGANAYVSKVAHPEGLTAAMRTVAARWLKRPPGAEPDLE